MTDEILAIAASAPPAMIASVPAFAAPGPPDTGASTNIMPRCIERRGDLFGRFQLSGRKIDADFSGGFRGGNHAARAQA